MNIYRHEFKSISRSVITWAIAIFAVMLLYMSVFSGFTADAEMVNEMMAEFPPELLAAFGMTNLDLSTVLGYFSIVIVFVQVLVAVQAANYGFGLVSIEERELTADFLLTKPVGRPRILTSKLLAALTGLAITNLLIWTSSFLLISIFSDGRSYDTGILVLLLLTITFIQLFFLTVALIISLFVKKIRNVTPYAMGLVFGLYVLAAFSSMAGEVFIENISPFKHFEASYIVANGTYDAPLIYLTFALILVSVIGSYILYNRRDIHSV